MSRCPAFPSFKAHNFLFFVTVLLEHRFRFMHQFNDLDPERRTGYQNPF
jgi:hypothetical protein